MQRLLFYTFKIYCIFTHLDHLYNKYLVSFFRAKLLEEN